jgi:uncharacterized protein
MLVSLPTIIDPVLLAEKGSRLSGRLPLKGMPRLAGLCLDATGVVLVELTFERGEGCSERQMHGTLSAAVRVGCQRCLEPMTLELKAEPRLALRRPGEPQDPAEAEVLVVDKPLALSELVEDELLLVMPMVPLHASNACAARNTGVTTGTGRRAASEPFAKLKRLKRK